MSEDRLLNWATLGVIVCVLAMVAYWLYQVNTPAYQASLPATTDSIPTPPAHHGHSSMATTSRDGPAATTSTSTMLYVPPPKGANTKNTGY